MAQKLVTIRTDDVTGKEIEEGTGETISFAVGTTQYEIDLDEKGALKFHKALQFYIDRGRRVGKSNVSPIRSARKSRSDVDPAAVRVWAESNGIEVSSRGRIKGEVVAQFRAAGN
jgi:hypothetical protein